MIIKKRNENWHFFFRWWSYLNGIRRKNRAVMHHHRLNGWNRSNEWCGRTENGSKVAVQLYYVRNQCLSDASICQLSDRRKRGCFWSQKTHLLRKRVKLVSDRLRAAEPFSIIPSHIPYAVFVGLCSIACAQLWHLQEWRRFVQAG